jgi:hypothetical protein
MVLILLTYINISRNANNVIIHAQPLLLMRVGAEIKTVLSINLVTVTKLFVPTVKRDVTQIPIVMHSLMKLQHLLITTTATITKADHTQLEAVGQIQNVTLWNEVSFSHSTNVHT